MTDWVIFVSHSSSILLLGFRPNKDPLTDPAFCIALYTFANLRGAILWCYPSVEAVSRLMEHS